MQSIFAPPTLCGEEEGAEAGEVQLVLLRGFEVRHQQTVIDLPMAAQRLLAFLALHERTLQRSFVAGNLWIDSSESHAQATLRTTLWRIRQRGCDLVANAASGLSLAPRVAVDLHLASGCAHGVLNDAGPPAASGLSRLCDAGDLLPDWYDDWLLVERERFRQLRLHALEVMCRRLSDAGRHGDAAQAGIAAVACEPLRESAHRALVAAHIAAGNVGEALRQYELCRRLLASELAVEPTSELRRLVAPWRAAAAFVA